MRGRLAGHLGSPYFGDPVLRQPDGSRPASLSLTNRDNATLPTLEILYLTAT